MLDPAHPIYLDHHATTPCDPRVVEAMAPTLTEQFGNASSRQHAFGWQAEALIERAREQVAELIGSGPAEIVFTSGATESDNLALQGVARAYANRGRHVITNVAEHKAVLDTCRALEAEGFRVTYLPVDGEGRVRVDDLEAAIDGETTLVSVMFANNEIGTLNPIAEIGRLCKSRRVLFHCDAVQALGYLKCDVNELGVDLLSISGHKIYGPKGVGALYVRRRDPRVRLAPIIHGGGHERGMRSGTLNVSGIVGLGKACEIIALERERDAERVGRLRDRLQSRITDAIPEAEINGSAERRAPNNLNISFEGLEADAILSAIPGIAVSTGSACTSATQEPSHVLAALGLSEARIHGSIRFGLGRFTSEEEIDLAAQRVISAVHALYG